MSAEPEVGHLYTIRWAAAASHSESLVRVLVVETAYVLVEFPNVTSSTYGGPIRQWVPRALWTLPGAGVVDQR